MTPMRRSLYVFSFLLLLLPAASVAQVGNTPRPAPTTRHRRPQCNDSGNRDTGPGTHGQDGNDRRGDPVHDRELERQKGCAYPLGDGESECSYGGDSTCRAVPADAGLLAVAEKAALDLKLAPVKTVTGERTLRVVTGVIVTGDAFVASPAKKEALRKEFKADATEMEGAAVAQICWQRRVPCLILRSLSDSAGAKAPENVLLFEKSAAQNAALLVAGIVGRLEAQ